MAAQLQIHEAANKIPPMSDEEYQALVVDIQKHGLRDPIVIYEGKLLDGRHRYRACQELGVQPQFREWTNNGSPLAYVYSVNAHRRHLSASQKAMLAVEIEKELAVEAKQRQLKGKNLSQTIEQGRASEKAAKIVGANRQYVSDAKKIVEKAPEVAERVTQGKMDIPDARAIADLNPAQQKAALTVLDNGYAKNGRDAASIVMTHNPTDPQALEHAASIPRTKTLKREPSPGERWTDNLVELLRKVNGVSAFGGMKKVAFGWSDSLLVNNYESITFLLGELTKWKADLEDLMKQRRIKK